MAPIAAKLISLISKRFDDMTEIPGLIPTALAALGLIFAELGRSSGIMSGEIHAAMVIVIGSPPSCRRC